MHITRPDGARIYYDVCGEGEPLMLIMGLGAPSNLWQAQVAAFSPLYKVITLDNRGIGRSDKPEGTYTIAQMAEDALSVLDTVGVGKSHIVGLSMGGMIAQELALLAPARVGALVLAATFAKPTEEGTAAVTQAVEKQKDKGPVGILLAMMNLAFSPDFFARDQAKLSVLMTEAASFGFHPPGFLSQMAATAAHDTIERLPKIKAPTLVLHGDRDALVPPRCGDLISSLIPGAKHQVIAGAGHTLNLEDETAFNQAVLQFLRQNPLG